MSPEIALLHNYLIVGALLFGIGLIGFMSRRNMIVMFLAAEMMLQGVSLSLVAWSQYHNNFGGQMLVIFIIAIAACEAAIVLGLVTALFQRSGRLDIADWHNLRESNQPGHIDAPLSEELSTEEVLPTLSRAGVAPQVPPDKTDYRPKV
jgi:NADH-quinone oxidoreductase subunit K